MDLIIFTRKQMSLLMKNIIYILLTFMLISCTKYEIEEVSGNTAPDEILATQVMKEAYVNRLYISLTGRKASSSEFDSAMDELGTSADISSREAVVNLVFSTEDYTIRLYDIARGDYLESLDTSVIRSDYNQVVFALQTATGPTREYLLEAKAEFEALLEIPEGLIDHSIDVTEMYRRVVNNVYYDDINMGSENFVVATFQNFLFRYPTNVELENGTTMVDGQPSSVFLKAGNSKEDFIDIFFDTDDYAEGIVINLFRKYLFREPSTEEMYTWTNEFLLNKDFSQIQKSILTSDEYFFN